MSRPRDADRELVFGALALKRGLIDESRLAEALASRRGEGLADRLVASGMLAAADREAIEAGVRAILGEDTEEETAATPEGVAATRPGDPEATRSIADGSSTEGHFLLSTLAFVPERAERYSLTRLHAEGGLGRVWLARDAALGREVALKELRPDRARDPAVCARFVEEARITGRLEHPGIVPIYELTRREEDGRPFYTMRFVKGRTLAEAARACHRDRKLGRDEPMAWRALVEAFVGVCNAVAFAHSRGVLHRDLKGANVVLGDFGEVMVLDWGLAKRVDGPEEDATAAGDAAQGDGSSWTVEGQAMGTPAYMAPEQASGDLARIDRRTDVYGLGATLYEVLAGRPPFGGPDTAEVLRRVREEVPEPPGRLNPGLPRALEAVCLKALEKRPEDRYQDVADLAADVRRWLADEPVSAYREPAGVRLGRWARRHRTGVAAASALLVAAVVALAITAWLVAAEQRRTELARRDAEQQARRADANFRAARRAVDDSFTRISEDALLKAPGLQPLRKQLLNDALRYYRGFLGQRDEPAVRAELASTYARVGRITAEVDRRDDAIAADGKALALIDHLPDDRPTRLLRARVVAHLGRLQGETDRVLEGLVNLRAAIGRFEAEVAADPADPGPALDLAEALDDLGTIRRDTHHPDDATAAFRRALAIRERLRAAGRDDPRVRAALARGWHNLATLALDARQTAEAEAEYRKAIDLWEGLTAAEPDDPTVLHSLARSYRNLGMTRRRAGAIGEAIGLYTKALAIHERLVAANPAVTLYREDLSHCLESLGNLRGKAGQLDDALAAHRRALAIREALLAGNPEVTWYWQNVYGSRNNMALLLARHGRLDEALTIFRSIEIHWRKRLSAHPDDLNARTHLGAALANTAGTLADLGHPVEAEAAFRESVAEQRRAFDRTPTNTIRRAVLSDTLRDLGEFLLKRGRPVAAASITLDRRALWPDNPDELFDVARDLSLCLPPLDPSGPDRPRIAASALDALHAAVAAGFRDAPRMAREPDLASLHSDPSFRTLLLRLFDRSFPVDPFRRGPRGPAR
ncbi:MAG TPA: serine/threonine-protein kinase [Isosphaeraceae bacterium]|jgi:serine/threonine-protein kinase|nr:serine/threonine-protein kinase [Isosphaeraceae bacterium]